MRKSRSSGSVGERGGNNPLYPDKNLSIIVLVMYTLASESRDIKKPSESCIFEFDKKLHKYGTLQAKQK